MINFIFRYLGIVFTILFRLLIPIIFIVLAVLIIIVIYAAIRTLFLKKKTTYLEYSTDEKDNELLANKLSKLVQVETVSQRGVEDPKKFRKFHTQLKKLYPNVFNTLEKVDIDGNLLLKWKGKNSKLDPILLMSHMDVVEATGKWDHDPFGGEISDGKVWGRGTADTKGSVMCFYEAVEELIKDGYKPNCDVYLSSSCTEEIGGDGAPKICKYLKDKKVHLFMLSDEGGGIVEDPVAGAKGHFASIGIFEKGYGDLKFIARSSGGHSSMPGKNTPIVKLAKFESYIEKENPFKKKFSPAVINMFISLAPYCKSFSLKMLMYNVKIFQPLFCILLPKISPQAAAMIQTTIAFTMQSGSNGYNVLPQEASVIANMRFIPHEPKDVSINKISYIAKQFGLDTEIVAANDHSKSLDLNGEAYKLTTEVINEVWPGIGIMPYVVTGGTDARFFDDVCDSCVRFSPLAFGPEQLKGMHGLNECIDIGVLRGGVNFYKGLIKAQEKRK